MSRLPELLRAGARRALGGPDLADLREAIIDDSGHLALGRLVDGLHEAFGDHHDHEEGRGA